MPRLCTPARRRASRACGHPSRRWAHRACGVQGFFVHIGKFYQVSAEIFPPALQTVTQLCIPATQERNSPHLGLVANLATPECNRDLAPRLIARGLFLVSPVSVLGFWEQPQRRCAEIWSYSPSDTIRTLSSVSTSICTPFHQVGRSRLVWSGGSKADSLGGQSIAWRFAQSADKNVRRAGRERRQADLLVAAKGPRKGPREKSRGQSRLLGAVVGLQPRAAE
jgi:hypothetical protein